MDATDIRPAGYPVPVFGFWTSRISGRRSIVCIPNFNYLEPEPAQKFRLQLQQNVAAPTAPALQH
jgi:hypothetical protein